MTPDPTKKERNGLALSIGLGLIAGLLTVASAYGAPITFLFFSVLSPLIVSLVAPNRSTALSILANLVHLFSIPIFVLVILWILGVSWKELPRDYADLGLGLLLGLAVSIGFAWATSALVRLIRRKLGAKDHRNKDTLPGPGPQSSPTSSDSLNFR